MGSTFSSYSIATSGMQVSQTALTVVSHNITNIATTGYSRQQVALTDICTETQSGNSTGVGCAVAEICRARNSFLDGTYREQNAESGYWEVKNANLEDMQLLLNEYSVDDGSSDNGFQATLTDFFNSWAELAKDPSSLSTRQAVIEAAQAFIEVVTSVDEQLAQSQTDACQQVRDGVDQLNDLASQVVELNKQIVQAELGGAESSDLRDQRDSLLDEMSQWTDISVQELSNGMVKVSIGGVPLVNGYNANTLAVDGDGSTQNPLTVRWAESETEVAISGGKLKAYLEDADKSGITAIDLDDLPYNFDAASVSSISNLRQGLNALVTTIALNINELHQSGYGLDGSTGLDFIVPADSSEPLSLSNLTINSLLDDENKIAASAGGESGDGSIADQIGSLMEDATLFQYETLSLDGTGFYQKIISWLGTEGDKAGNYYETKSTLVAQIDSRRQSISSVSLDEELSKMTTYQNAYDASARVLSVVDSLLEGLIEDLG